MGFVLSVIALAVQHFQMKKDRASLSNAASEVEKLLNDLEEQKRNLRPKYVFVRNSYEPESPEYIGELARLYGNRALDQLLATIDADLRSRMVNRGADYGPQAAHALQSTLLGVQLVRDGLSDAYAIMSAKDTARDGGGS